MDTKGRVRAVIKQPVRQVYFYLLFMSGSLRVAVSYQFYLLRMLTQPANLAVAYVINRADHFQFTAANSVANDATAIEQLLN